MHPMPPPGQQLEAGPRARLVFGLGQNPPAAGDDRIGGQDKGAGMALDHHASLLLRETHCMRRRQLARQRRLIDMGGIDAVR
jgi:hypothetical protein